MEFQRNVSLAAYTTLKIGGPAEYFFVAEKKDDVLAALNEAKKRTMSVTVLGGGTNVLIADEGIPGLTILMRIDTLERHGTQFYAEAGVVMGRLIAQSVAQDLAGLAWAGGLPGRLGGAIAGNAGTFGHAIGDSVVTVEAVCEGAVRSFSRDECNFRYRTSRFKEDLRGAVILSATLQCSKGDHEKLREEMRSAVLFRDAHHPAPLSAGSFFKNPDAPEGFSGPVRDGHGFRKAPAGWLIEQVGLKGVRIGGAAISEKHANFVINAGGATAKDVQALAQIVQEKVFEKFGIHLEEEVRMLPE